MHRGQLVVTDDIAALGVVVFLHTLMRHVAEKDNAVSCLRMDDPATHPLFATGRSLRLYRERGLLADLKAE